MNEMTDIYQAIAWMTAVSLAAGFMTGCVAYRRKGQQIVLCLSLSVVAAVYFQLYGSGQLFWARFIPNSATIIYSNFAAVFAALATGWALRLPDTPKWRRYSLGFLLACMTAAAILWPLLSIGLRPPPNGGDDWNAGVAIQTSWATCSPAAVATLLHHEGIDVSEAEMIPLCLSDSSGTPTLGLYRAVKLVADRENRSVTIVTGDTEQLLSENDWPVLLAVELPFGVADRRYADQWGWIPGMGHSVVALGRDSKGRILIGDPSVGLEFWTPADLELLWHGNGLRID